MLLRQTRSYMEEDAKTYENRPVLVIGATATVGREVLLALNRLGVQVRAAVTDPVRLRSSLRPDIAL